MVSLSEGQLYRFSEDLKEGENCSDADDECENSGVSNIEEYYDIDDVTPSSNGKSIYVFSGDEYFIVTATEMADDTMYEVITSIVLLTVFPNSGVH